MNFSGKTVVVTGSSKGIGKAVAIKFSSLGANVVLNARNETTLTLTLREIEASGGNVSAICGDVSDFSFAQHLVNKTKENYGTLDFIVNNAGITKDALMLRMSVEDFESVINVNLNGTFNVIKAACGIMIKQRFGVITNISSIVGRMGNAGQSNYAASKAAIIGLSKSVAKEFSLRGIRCNVVAPGFIETDMTDKLSDKMRDTYLQSIPLQRFGTAEDVANLVAFLSSSEASYITGQVINVDGGLLM